MALLFLCLLSLVYFFAPLQMCLAPEYEKFASDQSSPATLVPAMYGNLQFTVCSLFNGEL